MADEDNNDIKRPQITYDLPAEPAEMSMLEQEREKHRRRAAKFGSDYVEPGRSRQDRDLQLAQRKEKLSKPGFATGIDLFSNEETERRAARAARFNIAEPQGLQYQVDEDEQAKMRRAKKFGTTYTPPVDGAMMDMDLFEERAEVAHDVERRPDAIYLYGVDVMSTAECMSYFGEYGPTFVEWINDSSCVVTFEDRFSAARAMAGCGRALPPEEMLGESSAGLDVNDPANMPYFWHKGKDFTKQGTPIHLIYRMACVTDKKDPTAPRKTRELWKSGGGQGYQRNHKSRRTHADQSAGAARVDQDGDVEMVGADEEGGGRRGGRGARERRRKQRAPDGTTTTVMEHDGQEQAPADGPMHVDPPVEVPLTVEEAAPVELDPYEGRMSAHEAAASEPQSLLQRILKAKSRAKAAKSTAGGVDDGHQAGGGEAVGGGEVQAELPAAEDAAS